MISWEKMKLGHWHAGGKKRTRPLDTIHGMYFAVLYRLQCTLLQSIMRNKPPPSLGGGLFDIIGRIEWKKLD